MHTPYVPIDCNFYDELTLRAMRGRPCTLRYRDEGGKVLEVEAVIEDVYTQGPEEFVRLRGGVVIRLDRIEAVDGIAPPASCGR